MDEGGKRVCPKCKTERDGLEFNVDRYTKTGRYFRCKFCQNESTKKWQRNNPEKAKLCNRRVKLKRAYNLTIEDYDLLLSNQEGRCAICRTDSPGRYGRFHVDHDHNNGKNRGLLCSNCNVMLGMARDNESVLRSAADYLIFYKETEWTVKAS